MRLLPMQRGGSSITTGPRASNAWLAGDDTHNEVTVAYRAQLLFYDQNIKDSPSSRKSVIPRLVPPPQMSGGTNKKLNFDTRGAV